MPLRGALWADVDEEDACRQSSRRGGLGVDWREIQDENGVGPLIYIHWIRKLGTSPRCCPGAGWARCGSMATTSRHVFPGPSRASSPFHLRAFIKCPPSVGECHTTGCMWWAGRSAVLAGDLDREAQSTTQPSYLVVSYAASSPLLGSVTGR